MGKRTNLKRLSSVSQSASKSVDTKARKRIEELYELTDEIINAYNEINDKYINQIYRKYKQLQEVNARLKEQLNSHHCTGCKCTNQSIGDEEEEVDDGNNSVHEPDDDYRMKNSTLPSSSTNSVITRSKKNNPFIIADIEDTQNFDANDSRFIRNIPDNDNENDNDNEELETSMNTSANSRKPTSKNGNDSDVGSEEEDMAELWSWAAQGRESDTPNNSSNLPSDEANTTALNVNESNDEDSGMAQLPVALQEVIRRKAARNKKDKFYLLHIPRYPALCEFLRDKSRTSFDHRPSDIQVRPLIANSISQHLANDSKARMRVRDELREIHRSYMRTFMTDPHVVAGKLTVSKSKQIPVKKSPV
ncbi:unnamed protein product [Adineta steineri]|uniref:Uncharacterized protein n=1 Tax=Adineta steineri TaxID=433720 RepID=A0A816CR45_9BILA|nr:unnamed protein product [Adineta steineri]CAF1625884.1 unnamed protein product [Adineta steineri]